MKRERRSSDFIGSEFTKFAGLMLVISFLLVSGSVRSQQRNKVFTATVPHPVHYNEYETHRLELVSDSVLLYSHFKNSSSESCDSIIPAKLYRSGHTWQLAFPDREDWVLAYEEQGRMQVLKREDGLFFYFYGPGGSTPPTRYKKGKSRNKTLRCPEF